MRTALLVVATALLAANAGHPAETIDAETAKREHWAYKPLQRPPVPNVADPSWVRTPIDAFILKRLEDAGERPAPPAGPETLLRRVYLDLIGLPPTPSEQRAFRKGPSDESYALAVWALLMRPQYGERWGRHWLDVARYAETKGYERDDLMPNAWRYRDWVIDAFNADMPYDRFLTEQVAGDEMEGTNARTQIATSFLSIGPFDTIVENGNRARYDQLDDMLDTVASAFLGMTLRCARCHDHKFEPVSQRDYYRLLAAFTPLDMNRLHGKEKGTGAVVGSEAERKIQQEQKGAFRARLAPYSAALEQLRIPVLERLRKEGPPKGKKERLNKGDLGAVIAALRVLPGARTDKQKQRIAKHAQAVRDAVKDAATDTDKALLDPVRKRIEALEKQRSAPLRAWVFSESSPKPKPTHVRVRGDADMPGEAVSFRLPAVLDDGSLPAAAPTPHSSGRRLALARWLTGGGRRIAARVMANRVWQTHFGRGFVADASDLGVAAAGPSHPELLDWLASELVAGGWRLKRLHKLIVLSNVYRQSGFHPSPKADPDNRLFSRWPQHRLSAEAIRDSILHVSGGLNLKMRGPSIHPPFARKVVGSSAPTQWKTSDPREAARRSVYVFAKRAIPLPELALMDLPDQATSCARRKVSTTAVQALLLFNGRMVAEEAARLAAVLRREADDDQQTQARLAFERILCRPPTERELKQSQEFLASDSLAALCRVLMNTNEFAYQN